MASAYEKIYNKKLEEFLKHAIVKGGIEKYISENYPDLRQSIKLRSLLKNKTNNTNKNSSLLSNSNFKSSIFTDNNSNKDTKNQYSRSKSTLNIINSNKSISIGNSNLNKIDKDDIFQYKNKFDPPELSNETIFKSFLLISLKIVFI